MIKRLVEVVAAQVRIAAGADHLEHLVAFFLVDAEHGNVERAAAEVEHDDFLADLLVQAVGHRGRGRLVDDAGHFQARDLPGVFGRLPLRVVEVRGDGDDRLVDLVSQVRFGGLLQLAQRLGRDFLRRVVLAVDLHLDVVRRSADDLVGDDFLFGFHLVVAPAHEPLDRIDRAVRIGHRLAPRGLADQRFAPIRERHDAGRQPVAFRVRDHFDFGAFHDRHHRIGRSQVDPDDFFALSH